MFKLIRRRKKRTKEKRKKWLKRSRPRSEHQKHKKLNEYILTWQPNYYRERIYWEKNLDDFSAWNFHLCPSHYWHCSFLHFVWLRTSINQVMETWNVFDQINSFHYSFSSSSRSNSNSCHGLNIGMTLCKSCSICFGIAQISFEPSPLAHPCNMGTLWHFSSQKLTRLELFPSESK